MYCVNFFNTYVNALIMHH